MAIKSMKGLKGSEIILAERTNKGTIEFNSNQTFGNPNINGLQAKGMARIYTGPEATEKFVKLDTLSPKRGQWEDNFDYKYSSISENIVSLFLKNSQPQSDFSSVIYDFEVFEQNGSSIPGTTSQNFLTGDDELELLYSTPFPVEGETTAIGLQEFIDKHIDKPQSKSEKLQGFIDGYIEAGVNPTVAKNFLVQQAGFDLLMGNEDRLNNPGNFVFKYDQASKSMTPMNLDYGRCLQINWPQTMEERYVKDEFYDEDVSDYAKEFSSGSDSIIGDKMAANPKNLMTILKDFDFKPFQVNLKNLKSDLKEFVNTVKDQHLGIDNFVNIKVDSFIESLENGPYKALYNDISHQFQTEKEPLHDSVNF